MFGSLGTTELLLILAIVVILFGAKKIPDLASGIGSGIRNFKKALNEDPEKDAQGGATKTEAK